MNARAGTSRHCPEPPPLRNEHTRRIYKARRVEAIAARWDARAPAWDKALQDPAYHLNEDQSYARFLEEARGVIRRRARFCSTRGVVDMGCGTGLVLAEVAAHFEWGTGVDISRKMIQYARRKRIPGVRFLVGDAFNLGQLCPPAGAILSRGILLSHYGRAQSAALLKALRLRLLPKGFLILDFLNREARDRHEHTPEAKTYFDGKEVREMALRAGFNSAKILGKVERRVLLLLAEA